MLGLNDFVIVTVVNALVPEDKKPTNYFDEFATVRIAMLRTIHRDTIGNQHIRSDIQKQAYPSEQVKTVRQAYGLTDTDFTTHTPFRNGKLIELDSEVCKNTEIVLVKNGLNLREAIIVANVHRVLPERTGS